MFCQSCSDWISYGSELKNEKGRIQPHTNQICGKCRTNDHMSEKEVKDLLAKKVAENKNPPKV